MDPEEFNWEEFADAAMGDGGGGDPYLNPGGSADVVPPSGAVPPFANEVPSGYTPWVDDNPWTSPVVGNSPAARMMNNALDQVGEKMGGDYYRSGGKDWGGPMFDENERPLGPGGGMAQLNPNSAIDYGASGTDMQFVPDGGLPMARVFNMAGKQLAARPVDNFSDYGSFPSSRDQKFNKDGTPMLDDKGEKVYGNLPGVDMRGRVAAQLDRRALENGNIVGYNPFDNTSFGIDPKTGQYDKLLIGGAGLDAFTREQAMRYGLIPGVSKFGTPVYSEGEQGNRSWLRDAKGGGGRQILDVNRDPRFLNGQRAAGGGGGGGGQGGGRPIVPTPVTGTEKVGFSRDYGPFTVEVGTSGAYRIKDNTTGTVEQVTQSELNRRIEQEVNRQAVQNNLIDPSIPPPSGSAVWDDGKGNKTKGYVYEGLNGGGMWMGEDGTNRVLTPAEFKAMKGSASYTNLSTARPGTGTPTGTPVPGASRTPVPSTPTATPSPGWSPTPSPTPTDTATPGLPTPTNTPGFTPTPGWNATPTPAGPQSSWWDRNR